MNIKKFIGGLFMTKEQKLNKEVSEQKNTINRLSTRISELVDRVSILENDIGRFKKSVSVEIRKIVSKK
jgi:predicted  nucleic acid-binding Zn-ribbon protein